MRQGRCWLLATAVAAGWAGSIGGAEVSAPQAGPASNATTVWLEYREANFGSFVYDICFRDVSVERRSSPFNREPTLERGRVFRGTLKFGSQPANAVAFLWQTAARKLYLDLNRNLDLTDDPAGVFAGQLTGPRLPTVNHQVFTNVHLAFPATSGGAPVMIDLNFFHYGESAQPHVNAMGRSFWQGKLAVGEHEWQIGLVPNLSDQPGSLERGQLLVRPWAERNQPFCGWSSTIDSWALPFEYRNRVLKAPDAFEFSRQIFFDNHAWRLDWSAQPQSCDTPFALRFIEEHPALGDLRLPGRFIERLVLSGGEYAVVLVRPSESVQVPVGSYNQPTVWLKQGSSQAYFDSLPSSGKRTEPETFTGGIRPISGVAEAGKVVLVREDQPATLAMGGPLTNSIAVTRQGQDLKLTYRLLGAGGGDYKLWEWWRTNRTSPPRFTVLRGERKLASDKFEFG